MSEGRKVFKACKAELSFRHPLTRTTGVTKRQEALYHLPALSDQTLSPRIKVGGIDQPGVQPAIPNGVIDQPRVHLSHLRAIKLHLVGLLKGLSFPSLRENPGIPDPGPSIRVVESGSRSAARTCSNFCRHFARGPGRVIFSDFRRVWRRERVSIIHVSRFEPYRLASHRAFYRVVGFLWTHALIDTVNNPAMYRCIPGNINFTVFHSAIAFALGKSPRHVSGFAAPNP